MCTVSCTFASLCSCVISDCRFVDDCPNASHNYLRYVVGWMKRAWRSGEERMEGRAQDPKVTRRVGDLADLIGHWCFPSRTIDVWLWRALRHFLRLLFLPRSLFDEKSVEREVKPADRWSIIYSKIPSALPAKNRLLSAFANFEHFLIKDTDEI